MAQWAVRYSTFRVVDYRKERPSSQELGSRVVSGKERFESDLGEEDIVGCDEPGQSGDQPERAILGRQLTGTAKLTWLEATDEGASRKSSSR